jgi:hypothetical protein
MRAKVTETELLRKAIAAFNQHFSGQEGLEISTLDSVPQEGSFLPDVLVRLRIGQQEILYHAELKREFSHAVRQYLLMNKASLRRPLLVITHYVNPEMADQMKRDGLEFIDTAGNAFIRHGQVYVFAKGNRLPARTPLAPAPRLFMPAGLRIVYSLLSRPSLVNGTYRAISAASGVALGTVAGIMVEMKARLFLAEDRNGARRLIRKKDLFDNWVAAYPERLRPRLLIGRYQGDYDWWHEKVLQSDWGQWGGEVAASRITRYLFPQLITVYLVRARLNDFLLENRLRSEPNGTVEILERFWTPEPQTEATETVHPILIYADLVASGINRNIEIAKTIYDEHIVRYLRED